MAHLQGHQYEVLEFTRCHSDVTRPLLADSLRLSLPTVSVVVRELLDAGILAEDGYLKSSGGRRASVLKVNGDFATAIGVAVSMVGVRAVLANAAGEVLGETRREWTGPLSRDSVLEGIFEAISSLPESADRPAGIGVGISGLVKRREGVSIRFPYVEDWVDVPLASLLHERFGLDAFLDNDVNASTLAELRFGKGRGVQDFLYAYVGKGIGLGIVVGGKLYRGASGNAGELGHMAFGADRLLCHCGNYGCLETVAGPEAIVSEVAQALAGGAISSLETDAGSVSIEGILKAAEEGDRLCENVVAKAAEHIGRMTGSMANLFDPELVVLGGLLAKAPARMIETLTRVFESRVLPSIAPTVRLEVSELGDVAGALGAADVVFQNHLNALRAR